MQVSQIDVLVYPCWSFGDVPAPKTGMIGGMKVSYTRRASGAQMNIWRRFADDIASDPSRLLLMVNNEYIMTRLDEVDVNQLETMRYAQKVVGNRCYTFLDKDVGIRTLRDLGAVAKKRVLSDRIAEDDFYVSAATKNIVYGHHRGDCTIKVGRKALVSLGMDPNSLQEHRRASVTSHSGLVKEIVKKYSPALFAEIEMYEPQYDPATRKSTEKVMRATSPKGKRALLDGRFFFHGIYHILHSIQTPLQIKHLVENINTVDELLGALGIPVNASGHQLEAITNMLFRAKKPLVAT